MAKTFQKLLNNFVFGRRLASDENEAGKIGVFEGLPIFGLDGLSSSAYGPEAALTMLIPLGAAGLHYIGPITLPILILLFLLYLSYRQTIEAYPVNGGSYTVSKDNLGVYPSLLAAASLMLDYVLNVAVGISAGVAALVSAVPGLHGYTLELCLGILLVLTLTNLRGTKEAGWAFAAPTYLFLLTLGTVLVVGVVRAVAGGGRPQPIVPPPALPRAEEAVSLWLLLRAFASGCTAMTGVEAVSNGVGAFKDPAVKYARWTLTAIVALLALLLAGIAYLSSAYGIGAMDQNQPGYQSILSQVSVAVVGRNWFYFVTMGSVLLVLAMSANTSFAGFPRLCRLVAMDDFLPRPFAIVGRRLVYSVGILVLASAAGILLFAFDGITDRLIPLFAIGAFTAFFLSQTGMVMHWWKQWRGTAPAAAAAGQHAGAQGQQAGAQVAPSASHSKRRLLTHMAANATGATGTGIALAIITIAKFAEGAWISILVIPALMTLFVAVRRHYSRLGKAVNAGAIDLAHSQPPVAVVPIGTWDKPAAKSLQFAMWLSSDVIAIHLGRLSGDADDPDDACLKTQWNRCVEEPAQQAGVPVPQLRFVKTPYRTFEPPLLAELGRIEGEYPGRPIAVAIPMLIPRHWWQYLLHMRRSTRLRAALMKRGDRRVIVISVPWYMHE